MRHLDWKNEAWRLLLIVALAGVLGWLFHLPKLFMLLAALGCCAWYVYQLKRIQSWLQLEDSQPPPESAGLWGEIFDGIYRLQKYSSEEQQRLHNRLAYIRDSLASLPDGVVMLDQLGNIEWTNEAAEVLLGLSFPADQGQPLINLVRNPSFVQYFESEEYAEFLEIAPQQNVDARLQVQISFFGQGSRLVFVRDITHTHRLQQMRKDFVANVSHELRTPLTVITGYLETLSDSELLVDPRLERAFQQMLVQSHRMESLVRDLIMLSRLEAIPEAVEQSRIDVLPMLQMIKDEVLSAIKGERTIEIDCDASLSMIGQVDEIRSAFANLIMNAAKYSEPGGHIQVRWFADQQSAYLQVEDDGIGIAEHHIPRLTERFYRVDQSRHVETGGTGLGLAIVKHILSRHQGELTVSSVVGQGSCFSCVFPLLKTIRHSDGLQEVKSNS